MPIPPQCLLLTALHLGQHRVVPARRRCRTEMDPAAVDGGVPMPMLDRVAIQMPDGGIQLGGRLVDPLGATLEEDDGIGALDGGCRGPEPVQSVVTGLEKLVQDIDDLGAREHGVAGVWVGARRRAVTGYRMRRGAAIER